MARRSFMATLVGGYDRQNSLACFLEHIQLNRLYWHFRVSGHGQKKTSPNEIFIEYQGAELPSRLMLYSMSKSSGEKRYLFATRQQHLWTELANSRPLASVLREDEKSLNVGRQTEAVGCHLSKQRFFRDAAKNSFRIQQSLSPSFSRS